MNIFQLSNKSITLITVHLKVSKIMPSQSIMKLLRCFALCNVHLKTEITSSDFDTSHGRNVLRGYGVNILRFSELLQIGYENSPKFYVTDLYRKNREVSKCKRPVYFSLGFPYVFLYDFLLCLSRDWNLQL